MLTADVVLQEPTRPRLVSMLVYLNSAWPLANGAETVFLDSASDTGVAVRPKPGRVVLMDQDVLHRVSAPSAAAQRPRYSLVWKLVLMHAREGNSTKGQCPSVILHDRGGGVRAFGSAVKMSEAQAHVSAKSDAN